MKFINYAFFCHSFFVSIRFDLLFVQLRKRPVFSFRIELIVIRKQSRTVCLFGKLYFGEPANPNGWPISNVRDPIDQSIEHLDRDGRG